MRDLFMFVLISFFLVFQSCSSTTKIVAHRGAWKNTHLPQNSIASLDAAADLGVWGVELDVHLTKDDSMVVNHDLEFYGIDTESSTYNELLVKKHPNGEFIPSLRDFLLEAKNHKGLKIVLEIKPNKFGVGRTEKLTEMAYHLVQELGMKNSVDYISFSWEACLKVRELDKKANVYYLDYQTKNKKMNKPNLNKTLAEIKAARLTGIDYLGEAFVIHPNLVKEAKAMKLKTDAWTIDDANDMRYLLKKKIDFITTNEPELLKQILNKEAAK